MTLTRFIGLAFIVGVVGVSGGLAACGSGEDGAKGEPGATGPAGPVGPAGPSGAQGLPGAVADGGGVLSGACTTPCHTFGGVVDQWRFSNHSHPQNNEVGGGACGNCHAIDGIQQRVANKYTVAPDAGVPTDVAKGHINFKAASGAITEIGYGGATTIGRIHCSTCHAFDSTNDPHVTGKYVAGQAPLRVPGGVNDTVILEKTAGASPSVPTGQELAYRAGNVCVFCHKSRKDVSLYITASNALSTRWGPHDGPQADVYSGKGGYHFAGQGVRQLGTRDGRERLRVLPHAARRDERERPRPHDEAERGVLQDVPHAVHGYHVRHPGRSVDRARRAPRAPDAAERRR